MAEETYRYYVVYCSLVSEDLAWMFLNWPKPIDSDEDILKITESLNRGDVDFNYVILNWKRL